MSFFLTCVSLLLTACSGSIVNSTTENLETPKSFNTAISSIGITDIPAIISTHIVTSAEEVLEPKRTRYDLSLRYDDGLHIMEVEEDVFYNNSTGKILSSLQLILPFKKNHNFKLINALINEEEPVEVITIENFLEIPLEVSLNPGDQVQLSFIYTFVVPEGGGVLGRTAQQVNIADFYLLIPPYDEENGWIIHEPGVVGEYLVYDLADFYLEFSTNIPGEFQIFSNAPLKINKNNYIVDAEKYRNVVISICFDCSKREIDYGSFKVIGGFSEKHEIIGDETMNIIARALVYFTNLFGVAYPHPEMTILEADFPDGMEYDGLFFLSKVYFDQYDQTFMNYLSLLTVHETAHQWWFGMVANDQAIEPWLDEALATYSEYLFIEEFHPDLTHWWWNFRVDSYNPVGTPGSTIYEFDEFRPYINAVYLRGAHFVDDLRELLTDDVFFNRMRAYAAGNQNSVSNNEIFFDYFIPVETPNTIDLLEEYFHR